MSLELYIDESGNTHTNWADNSQPYFIYGGWLIESSKKYEIESYCNNLNISKSKGELKSSSIFKHNKNYSIFIKIFSDMICKYNAIPFFNICNKRYLVSSYIVETFFDPYYNSSLNYEILSSNIYMISQFKQSLASYILLNDKYNIIDDFSEVIQNKNNIDLNKMINIKDKLMELFYDIKIVYNSLTNFSNLNLEDMLESFNKEKHVQFFNSILLPVMSSLFMNLTDYLHKKNIKDELYIYYDSLSKYENFFKYVEENYWNISEIKSIKIDPNTTISLGFENLKSIKPMDSKNEILIQLSDLLYGFTYRVYRNFIENKHIDNNIKYFFEFIKNNINNLIIINEDTENIKLFYKIFGNDTLKNYNDYDVIVNYFNYFIK
ncbi:DUF3800 domain-containing protein [Brachyspira hyodysenteriae]|uniref:DUF3800 domain-containing protein n=2 Tax=Brachyspira hyodysenteriae TaxID=159 RepID=UPI0022CDADEE|nr:DUF3800 domain-containing protein [Brachyspira hyodysenteriae]MCZ9873388.1 DUF3800 domain-containing protein [Brachyspira hyodysenteriae]